MLGKALASIRAMLLILNYPKARISLRIVEALAEVVEVVVEAILEVEVAAVDSLLLAIPTTLKTTLVRTVRNRTGIAVLTKQTITLSIVAARIRIERSLNRVLRIL